MFVFIDYLFLCHKLIVLSSCLCILYRSFRPAFLLRIFILAWLPIVTHLSAGRAQMFTFLLLGIYFVYRFTYLICDTFAIVFFLLNWYIIYFSFRFWAVNKVYLILVMKMLQVTIPVLSGLVGLLKLNFSSNFL